MIANLATATPVEIDTEAARLDGEFVRLGALAIKAANNLHYAVGERPVKTIVSTGAKTWPTTHEQARDAARAILANPGNQLPYELDSIKRNLDTLAAADLNLEVNRVEAAKIEAEYDRRPWRRYVTVPGGHIHSGYWCAGGTIRYNTLRGWTPELSGKDVADAVAELGPKLCTHCFPSAPVEWTAGVKSDHCEGSGTTEEPGTTGRVGGTYFGRCRACGTNQNLTSRGVLRKHKPPKSA